MAAFAVVLCHFGHFLLPLGPAPLRQVMAGMFNAVGFFFMLSGFILAHTYGARFARGEAPVGRFYRARFARLYPAYFFALLLDFPSFFITAGERSWARVAEWSAVKLPMLQAWIPFNTVYVNQWNPPTWSISTEVFFYLAFPFLVVPIMRMKERRTLFLIVGVTLAMSAVALGYDFLWKAHDGADAPLRTFLITSPLPRLADFVLGIATYRLATSWAAWGSLSTGARRWLWSLLGIALVALWASETLHVAKSQGLTYPLFGLALLLLTLDKGRIVAFFSRPWIVRLGEESYALYLVHFPISLILVRLWRRIGLAPESSSLGAVSYGLATIVVSIVTARVVHQYIETPGRRLLMRSGMKSVPAEA